MNRWGIECSGWMSVKLTLLFDDPSTSLMSSIMTALPSIGKISITY